MTCAGRRRIVSQAIAVQSSPNGHDWTLLSARDVIHLIAALGDWESRPGSRYRRLADAITVAAQKGVLDGMRLPAERRLAEHLGLSRSTVVRAYGILRERGVVTSRPRSGTVVRPRGRSPHALTPLVDRLVEAQPDLIDLSFGAFPLDDLVRDYAVSLDDADRLAPAHGYAPQGLAILREAVAERYRRQGVDTAAEDILITSGAQEAINLLATVLTGRNQTVLVERTTFSGAIEAFVRAGAEVEGVAVDVAGLRPDHLRAALGRRPAAAVYLVPNCHNPTGGKLAAGRRSQVVDIAATHGVPVIEDSALDQLRFDEPAGPLLQALNPGGVFGVGGVSKIAWGGLRVGWLRGPRAEVLRLTQAKGCWNLGTSVLDQLVALRVLADEPRLAAARRAQAQAGLEVMCAALAEHLPGWEFEPPSGGVSLWVRLPAGHAEQFAAAAVRHGVAVGAGAANAPGDEGLDRLRLCFVLPERTLREGVRRLARAWETYAAQAPLGAGLPVSV